MGLFRNSKRQSVALIDINAHSVGGAYAHIAPGKQPTIYYTARVPIEYRGDESPEDSMVKALVVLGNILVNHGAPQLHEATGSARLSSVIVCAGAPWQETKIRSEVKQDTKPFLFTKQLFDEILHRDIKEHPERIASGETVIATMLNGYDIPNPVGKRAVRAELVVLSSTLEKTIAEKIQTAVRKNFHSHHIALTASMPLAFSVLRELYPHEKDFVVLDVKATGTDIAFIKRRLLSALTTIPLGTNDLTEAVSLSHTEEMVRSGDAEIGKVQLKRSEAYAAQVSDAEEKWVNELRAALRDCAQKQVLPHALFLLADLHARNVLERILIEAKLNTLWLSDDPIGLISLSPKHLSKHVQVRGNAEGDLFLQMMAVYSLKQISR